MLARSKAFGGTQRRSSLGDRPPLLSPLESPSGTQHRASLEQIDRSILSGQCQRTNNRCSFRPKFNCAFCLKRNFLQVSELAIIQQFNQAIKFYLDFSEVLKIRKAESSVADNI